MNSNTLRNLAIIVAVLLAVLVGLQLGDDRVEESVGERLFPDMRAQINAIERLSIERADAEAIVVVNQDDGWVLQNRDNYPADVAKVREVLLALADARILEQKTANPERYGALGVANPEAADGAGLRLTASGEGVEFVVIVGNEAQTSNRYVRRGGDAASVLIDANPALPADIGGWLQKELLDIDTARIASATIEHADGETLHIRKAAATDVDFTVADVPAGRELSYPTVANSIAGALNGLDFEDVRPATGDDAVVNTSYSTFDGLLLRMAAFRDADGSHWVAISASPVEASGEPAAEIAAEMADITARSAGREFRIADFRANQLTRRWEDILKPLAEEASE